MLDSGAQNLLRIAAARGRLPLEQISVAEARESLQVASPVMGGPPLHMAEIRNFVADDRNGLPALRLYRPQTAEQALSPALVFLHGGGWLLGDLDTHDLLCRQLAHAGRCQVVSVAYRLAPEAKFPAAIEDAAAAFRWVVKHAKGLGIDARRIGVAGDSAGGNLAAVLAIMARDGDLPSIRTQLLMYPVCDLAMKHASYERFADGYLLTRASMEYFIGAYIRSTEDIEDWRASPLRAPSLAGVAEACVVTAGYDPLCDEGDAYAAKLLADGVQTSHLRAKGQIHGFLAALGLIPEGAAIMAEIGGFLNQAWQSSPPQSTSATA